MNNMAFFHGHLGPQSMAPAYPEGSFELRIAQQPKEGRTLPRNQRMKGHTWPVDPPPVVELISTERQSEECFFIHNPNWFCLAELVPIARSESPQSRKKEESKDNEGGMNGSWSSSLHKVKGSPDENDRTEHGYFVFGDINIKTTGTYRLKFTLFEMRQHENHVWATKVNHVNSHEFKVHSNKGETCASTRFSRLLSDAGVKVKLRAEATKRKPMKIDWSSKQTDSMNRQIHLAPMQDAFIHSPTQGELRGRGNMSIDISSRIQTSHAPLTALTTPLMSPLTSNNHPGHHPNQQPPSYSYSIQQPRSQEWPVTMASTMQSLQSQYNPYTRMNEHLPYASNIPLQQAQPQLPLRLPSRLSDESGYNAGQPIWYQQQHQQSHHQQQQQHQQHQQQWYPQQQY